MESIPDFRTATPRVRTVEAGAYRVPPPFRAFAVRSEEPAHAFAARAPYGRVHVAATEFLDAAALHRLAALGYPRVDLEAFSDVDYATTSLEELCGAIPEGVDLVGGIAGALRATGVLGDDLAGYRRSVTTRVDFLGTRGAGFHNDVRGHWSRCLFWILALDVVEVDFALPHAGVLLPLRPGDLVVFDPALAHGLCRRGDGLQVREASFLGGAADRQMFLTGEIPLTDAQWAALGAPWLPVEEHEQRGALDLAVAEFDDRSGAIKRPYELRDGMKRSTCHVDDDAAP